MQHQKIIYTTLFFIGISLFAACDDATVSPSDQHPDLSGGNDRPPASSDDAEAPPTIDAGPASPTAACTTVFGHGITAVHGRLDGTVRAVVVPGDRGCASDDNHVIVQVDSGGATYPLWVDVSSDIDTNDPAVRVASATGPLVGPPWVDGWHAATDLDYASDLGMHASSGFVTETIPQLGALLVKSLPAGTKVSVFAVGFDTSDGAHKIHRNSGDQDGAIVVFPKDDGVPSWLLFHFSDQSF